jgi:hypothetical protein
MAGITLAGVDAWAAGDQLEAGAYVVRAASVERTKSKADNEQIQVDWRVLGGPFKGAEQRDWITFTENAMGRVVQVLQAIGQEVPDTNFASYGELADWVAGVLKKDAVTEVIIRLEPGQKDPNREFPKVAGYRKPSPSDIPSDASGFTAGPAVAGGVCKQADCSESAVKDGFCKKHAVPF